MNNLSKNPDIKMGTEADPKLMYSLAGLVQKITQDCKVNICFILTPFLILPSPIKLQNFTTPK